MSQQSQFSSGLSCRSLALLLALTFTAGCSGLNPLSLLSGSGTNVAANTQIGAENSQSIGSTTTNRPTLEIKAPVEKVVQDTSTTTNTTIDPLMLFLLVLGWLAPSPAEIGRGFMKLFKRG